MNSSSRFPLSSTEMFVRPVTLPPGWGKGFNEGCRDRIDPSAHHNDGNRLGRILGRQDQRVPSYCHDDINFEPHQLSRKLRKPIALPLRISVLSRDILSFYVATLAQSHPNCLETDGLSSWIEI